MNSTTTDFQSDLNLLSEQDMFVISQEMNMIEPSAGTEGASFGATLMEMAPSIETTALIGFFCLGLMLVYPVARKTRIAKMIRLHF